MRLHAHASYRVSVHLMCGHLACNPHDRAFQWAVTPDGCTKAADKPCCHVVCFVSLPSMHAMAGYYSCLSYSTAQLLIEVPYLLGLSIMFVSIIYPMIGFQWTAGQFFWCASHCSGRVVVPCAPLTAPMLNHGTPV